MIDKAKELAYLLNGRDTGSVDSKCKIITEWLEQNPVEPVVVGLSDDNVWSLAEAFVDDNALTMQEMFDSYGEWAKTQAFAQPEVKEVVIGLTDEQIDNLVVWLGVGFVTATKVATRVKEWLKTQTFEQQYKTDGFAEMQLDEAGIEYRALKAELEQLKSHKFTPNWDDAPKKASYARLSVEWLNNGYQQIAFNVLSQHERPKPTLPTIEVGQVWRSNDSHEIAYERAKIIGVDDEAVAYRFNEIGKIGVFDIEDFLAKFEQVQP